MPSSNKTYHRDKFNITEESNHSIFSSMTYSIIMTTTGMLGSIVSLIIFIRLYLNKKSITSLLYIIYSLLNMIYFIESCFFLNPQVLLNFYLLATTELRRFVEYSLSDSLTWMQVLISFNRFVYIVFPVKAKIMTKKVFIKRKINFFNYLVGFNFFF